MAIMQHTAAISLVSLRTTKRFRDLLASQLRTEVRVTTADRWRRARPG